MLIVNSYQKCNNCNEYFTVSSNHCDCGLIECPWCGEKYFVIKRNVQKEYNYMEIELRKNE